MTAQNHLEIKGDLRTHPFAELLWETSEAKLTGSFRLAFEANKVIVYLIAGKVVFAVSNARRHRLFEMLLRENALSKEQLVEIPNFTGDLELAANLKNRSIFSEAEINAFFSIQIAEILQTVFDWTGGEWIFSSQTRIKENIQFEIDTSEMLLRYARNLPDEALGKRFKNTNEAFGAKPFVSTNAALFPTEAFVLSRFEKSFLPVREINILSGLPAAATLRIIYTLWLGGFLFHQNWQAAFSERRIAEILSAKLSLKKETVVVPEKPPEAPAAPPVVSQIAVENVKDDIKPDGVSLDTYLAQVENAANYYEILNAARDADLTEIKSHYFALAKQFHPDMFHQEKDSVLLRRIQSAFAKTAQAYDTLRNTETRKVYNYKLDKNLVTLKPKDSAVAAENNPVKRQSDFAAETFEQGFNLLMEDEYEEAVPFLARAVQLAPDNAKFHAYYGKALSFNEGSRYQADTELQTAIRLEPKNPAYRLLSAEFYIQYNLFKRAEGELKRLLSIAPDNKNAKFLLDSLAQKS